jgi:uncharacterized damage-inducible protein DinB
MDKAQLRSWWDHFRTVNGITLRGIKEVPKDKIDSKPCKDMRTPKELIAHMYTAMPAVAEGITKGEITWAGEDDAKASAGIKSHEDLVRYASDGWKATDRAVQSLTDEQISAMVKTPWGQSFPGFVCVQILYDEHLHHRGQLYAYLRQMGIEPPFVWDFEHNSPEFQPRAATAQV